MKHKKIILITLILLWMVIIFIFSSQVSDKSSNISGNTIRIILNKLQLTQNMNEQQINEMVENLQTPMRKIAHFSIYTVGGVLVMVFFSKLNITSKKKIIYSLVFCAIYAVLDELHQYFVPGRSCEIRDVLIDSTGSLLGILVSHYIIKIFQKKQKI